MILVVTGVGFLIHVYAIGYMEGDPRYGRFFAYLNLFVFFMLLLVLADNYGLLYVGWEGVGLCSYLLIGFWFEHRENASAAKKAFITTRIGDTLMLVGLALIVKEFGTLDFGAVLGAPGQTIAEGTATAISLSLFAGAIGKSAQLPLHVWLPDAMAGPTPVSALIHAATMVTAGVYLVVRSAPLFELSDVALTVVLVVGLLTMLFAGTCALAQDDIKRVLAYSTISQLGFMFMAAGMRFYTGAIFMLVAHAFYKALMFLGAGSVMHGMHEETDLQRMGGLLRRMPVTGWTFSGRRVRAGRGLAARGLLREGPDPGDRGAHGPDVGVPARDPRRPAVRAVHRPAPVPRVLREGEDRGGRARARVAARDDGPARGPGRRDDRGRAPLVHERRGETRDLARGGGRAAART